MNHWQKLGLPVALGICAAFLNWQSISRKLEPRTYVAVAKPLAAGQVLTEDLLTSVTISHTANAELQSTLVPWSKRAALLDRFAQRPLKPGSLLTQYDIYESNVATKEVSEDDLLVHQKSAPSYFINNLVTVRDEEGRTAEGFRVLSIVKVKEGYDVRLAIDSKRLLNLKRSTGLDIEKLEIR